MNARFSRLLAAVLCYGALFAACTQKSAVPGAAQVAQLPDWRGLWIAEGQVAEISGFPPAADMAKIYRLGGFGAPWNGPGGAKFAAVLSSQGSRKAGGWGYPMMMNSSAPMQFVITPDETLIINMYREIRHIYTDGRDHPKSEDRWPTTWGDSIGHWEGDTLVVDTVSVTDPLKFFFFAPPLTDQAHYVERLRKAAPDRIEMQITIEDPQVLTGQWTEKFVYVRQPGLDRMIHDDYSNDRSELKDGAFTIEPPKN
jgi:hypothetical protein